MNREKFERALTPGPWHQDWPVHCFWCAAVYTDPDHYPYCSARCSIDAETSCTSQPPDAQKEIPV
jgi:hypothetical protein